MAEGQGGQQAGMWCTDNKVDPSVKFALST